MTVNSFTSVSLTPAIGHVLREPPITHVVIAAQHRLVRHQHPLGERQADVGRTFAGHIPDRFAAARWSLIDSGQPVVDGALPWLECEIVQVLPAGDHDIVLGEARGVLGGGCGGPLVYHGGSYLSLGEPT